MWPLRPGGTRKQYSSTLEDIQNHVLKGHPGTIRGHNPGAKGAPLDGRGLDFFLTIIIYYTKGMEKFIFSHLD